LRTVTDELTAIRERRVSLTAVADAAEVHQSQLRTRTAALETATTALEARHTDWVRDKQEAVTKRESLRTQYQDVKTQLDRIVELGEEGICPTCTRVLGDHFRAVHDGLEEQLETITVDGKYFNTRLDQLDAMEEEFRILEEQRKVMAQEVTDVERQLARAQTAAQDLVALTRELATKETRHDQLVAELRSIPSGFDERRHAELEREMDRLAPLNEQAARLSARIDREVVQREEYEAVSVKLAAARALVADLSARYAETKVSEREMQRQREAYETTVATLRQAELELQAATSEEVRAAEAVATAERDRLELDRAVALHARLDADRRLHDELDRAYTDLRTDLNFQLRPELSDLASQFLNQLTDGRYAELELDDQYSLVVLEDGVPKPVISGGEEDLSNLVLRLAISQMIADRSGQNFSLLVLDEVFGSLDVARRQNVVDLLRRLEGRFEQVILITHIEGVKDELDHVVLVDYDDQVGSTRVRHAELAIPDFEGLDAEEVPAGAET
jgi:exonuclease SbcC